MYRRLLFIVLLLIVPAITVAQDTWKLAAEKEGIQVYTRPVTNSKIKAIKVTCSLNASPAQLVALIMDIDNSDKWLYHSKLNRVIRQVSPTELYYYAEVNVPWPAQNRDYVSHIMVSQNACTKVITIDAPCVAGMVAGKKDVVRIVHSTGKWTITPTTDNNIKVCYELEVDPAGTTPAWLINLFATQGPMETFQKLKLQLVKGQYKDANLTFAD